MFLLDTNVWVTFLRDRHSPVVARLHSELPRHVRTCSIVVAELYYGCQRSAKPTDNRTKIDALIAPYPCLPFDKAAADQFATIRRHLESLGAPIDPYDLQIAAIALTHGCTLVTHNLAEFQRVPGGQAVPDFVAYNLNWKTRIYEPRSIEHRRCDRSL